MRSHESWQRTENDLDWTANGERLKMLILDLLQKQGIVRRGLILTGLAHDNAHTINLAIAALLNEKRIAQKETRQKKSEPQYYIPENENRS